MENDFNELFQDFEGDLLFDKYCQILEHDPVIDSNQVNGTSYPNSVFWGGQLELEMLSEKFNISIGIINATNSDITLINPGKEKTIYIYYTGSHYSIATKILEGGTSNDLIYKEKYIKYKQKYLSLQKLI